MGILANQTPQFSPGLQPKALTRSFLYCAGTESDPLRHEQEDSRDSVTRFLSSTLLPFLFLGSLIKTE